MSMPSETFFPVPGTANQIESYPPLWLIYGIMAKSLAIRRRTTTRKELLELMMESGLFSGKAQARAALGAVCVSLRAWLTAHTKAPDKATLQMLRLPGVGQLRIVWNSYSNRYAPHLLIRFTPNPKIREQVRAANKAEWQRWRQS